MQFCRIFALAFGKQVAMTDALHRWAIATSALSSKPRASRMVTRKNRFASVLFFGMTGLYGYSGKRGNPNQNARNEINPSYKPLNLEQNYE